MNKLYRCVCGKTFDNPQKFNGHKQGCKIHIVKKYGSVEAYYTWKNRSLKKGAESNKKNSEKRRRRNIEQWVSEKHTCERCGKVMTEKFGSGRFCSRFCANSHCVATETKAAISNGKKLNEEKKRLLNECNYYMNPKHCVVCGKPIAYERRRRITCSESCYKVTLSQSARKNQFGGLTSGCGNYSKHGYYKGFKCDSTYELAFTIYNIDHNVEFYRCPRSINYTYSFEGSSHRYYPDYLMGDGSLIEIKGYHSDVVDIKTASVTDRPIKVLYREDLDYAFNYVKSTYSFKKIQDLYD